MKKNYPTDDAKKMIIFTVAEVTVILIVGFLILGGGVL